MAWWLAAAVAWAPPAADDAGAYAKAIAEWRAQRERRLRADNGWLTLAGRFPLRVGANTVGAGPDNDVVLPPELRAGIAARLGAIAIEHGGRAAFRPAPDAQVFAGTQRLAGERAFDLERPDWIGCGRLRFHVIVREGRYFLRVADNESAVRKAFTGCVWYPVDPRFRVQATFAAHPAPRTVTVVNILGQTTEQPSPGYAEFTLGGVKRRLDALVEDGGLFFVFRDATARDATYPPGRFLNVERIPAHGEDFTLDFNKAYNPPCAFSAFTTCPVAPPGNVLDVRIEAGERRPAAPKPAR